MWGRLAFHEPGLDKDGPLSLSLSPPRGERVPKAGEGLVHGPDARGEQVEAIDMALLRSIWPETPLFRSGAKR